MKNIILFLCIVFFLNFASAEENIKIQQTLKTLQRDVLDLQKIILKDNKDIQNTNTNLIDVSEITVFDMRIRDIEKELKNLNFLIEDNSFKIIELNKQIDKLLINLNSLKVEQIQNSNNTVSDVDVIITDENNEQNTLGELVIDGNTDSDSKLILSEEKVVTNKDSPDTQYQKAYESLITQNYDDAKNLFEEFINQNESHELAGSANYWLGEIFFLQKEYTEAALVFAEGYQKYPDGNKTPDTLYKLAISLNKLGKAEDSCFTLNELVNKFSTNRLVKKAEKEIIKLECN